MRNKKWIVITADSGKSKHGQDLCELLRAHKITGVCIWRKLCSATQAEKAIAVLACWQRIKCTQNAEPGSIFHILRRDEDITFRESGVSGHKFKKPKHKKKAIDRPSKELQTVFPFDGTAPRP